MFRVSFFSLALLASLSSAWATVRYVSPTGNNANSGLTWAAAKSSINAATAASVPGDQVWVARGTYSAGSILPNGVSLYGGFVGVETTLAQQNPRSHPTILDGGGAGRPLTINNSAGSAVIDGFVIQNGRAPLGAGIFGGTGDYRISRCFFRGNVASSVADASGGAIYLNAGTQRVVNNQTRKNTATSVSGAGRGGGIYLAAGSQAVVANNMIGDNQAIGTAGSAGGGVFIAGGSVFVGSNTLTKNSSAQPGGGVASNGTTTLFNNILWQNTTGAANLSGSVNSNYNLYFGNGTNTVGFVSGGSDVVAAPLFTLLTPTDYHITNASPAYATALTAFSQGTEDYEGDQRVIGFALDRGADEFSQSGTPTIAGTVVLSDWNPVGGAPNATVTFNLISSDTGLLVKSYSMVATSQTMPFTLDSFGLPSGTYAVSVKSPKFLAAGFEPIIVNADGASGLRFVLRNGDADHDNSVTILDYSILSSAFDRSVGQAGYNDAADFDGDLSVTILDYAILSDNFDQDGYAFP